MSEAAIYSLVFDRKDDVADWVARRLPYFGSITGFGEFTAIGIEQDGEAIAGVVYHHFRPGQYGHDIQLSMAADSPEWARRGIIRALLRYPFVQLGCVRITTLTAKSNDRALRFNEGLGFKYEGALRKGADGRDDLIVRGLLREDAERWLAPHGKKQ